MDRDIVFYKLREVIVDQLNLDEDEVVEDARVIDDLGADSLDIVELVMAVEETFGISIADEDLDALGKNARVGEAVDWLMANI